MNKLDSARPVSEDHGIQIRCDCAGGQHDVGLQFCYLTAGKNVPDAKGCVLCTGDHVLSVGRHCNAFDASRVPFKLMNDTAGVDIPKEDPLAIRCCGDVFAVRQRNQRSDFFMGLCSEECPVHPDVHDLKFAFRIALAVVAGTGAAEAAEHPLTETEVTIKTPDGNCDAAFIHPTTGTFPGVLIWPDAFGLRLAMRQIARRIASEGYSVLVPNPFYRTAKAPVFDNPSVFDFSNPADTAKLPPLIGPIQAVGAAEKDPVAMVAGHRDGGAVACWSFIQSPRVVAGRFVGPTWRSGLLAALNAGASTQ
jgi:hypothetical protein